MADLQLPGPNHNLSYAATFLGLRESYTIAQMYNFVYHQVYYYKHISNPKICVLPILHLCISGNQATSQLDWSHGVSTIDWFYCEK